MAMDAKSFASAVDPTWCPGCGDFAVLRALQQALAATGKDPDEVLIVSGIGCSSNLPHFLKTYGFHSIHGRAIPVASGARLANPDLTVIAAGGDGDGYGIGCGHFVHAMRRNLDITYIVMDNQIYGLTTGQASPTTEMGHKTKSTPEGVIENPLNPLSLALSSGATFVARGFSGDMKNLGEIMTKAIQHKGFSLVDVFSPCVTYNKVNTYTWFKERLYELQQAGHDPSDLMAAFAKAHEWGARIPYGLFYETTALPTYEELDVTLKAGPVVKQEPLSREDKVALVKAFL